MGTHNELDRLAAARPAILARTEDVADAAEEDRILRRILHCGAGAPMRAGAMPQAHRRARRRQAGWLAGGAGLAAAAAAIAVAAATSTAAPGIAPGTRTTSPAEPTARAFLLAMAAKVSHASTGRYWCDDQIEGYRYLAGPGNKLLPGPTATGKRSPAAAPPGYQYSIVSRFQNKYCIGDRGVRNEGGTSQDIGARPATPADAAVWRRDGSPARWLAASGHHYLTMAPGPRFIIPVNVKGPIHQPWGSDASLPADPATLRKVLQSAGPGPSSPIARIMEEHSGLTYRQLAVQQLLFWAEMVMRDPVQPAVRAAAYQIVAGIPGIRVQPGVTGPYGRTGTAVWLASQPASVIIVDPATGNLLATETITTQRADGFPPGTFTYYEVDTFGWTNTLPSWAGHPAPHRPSPLAPGSKG